MARKITDKQLYKLKNDELKAMFTQVTPYEFYRDVFPKRYETRSFNRTFE